MLDFGLTDSKNMENYETKFLNELESGDQISGEIVIGEFQKSPMGKREVAEFYVIITDKKKLNKWVCEFVTPYYPETDNIYGENGGLFYTFIDSLNHVVNKTPLNWQENYSVNFSRFRKTVNQHISSITLEAVSSVNSDAKTVNLMVKDAMVKTESKEQSPATIYDLAQEDPIILMAYSHLRNKGDRITVKNIAFELKSSMDDGKITENAYKTALDQLHRLKPSVDFQ
ncbi:hypothetical protein [Methanobacterium formicicum]|uniref:Uncharacterized protein n=1 Tax=Methanobacterium formicicum (strain DSM 3637 / PP1) TaxID=1204725 RepID=K2RDV0_METFP|nr:hypothetical protein [Methanobacterium formicicum]EKF86524.1 hypothetical protein A994_03538 [Methanobacterium formicicum DSM 3637]